jgi:hypothetical protein
MLDGLDSIPWKDLTDAYGSAEDVPDLLRALQTASPELRGEQSPLWHLFGNIWHQGTVYEASAYAVPFLIELAESPSTPDRVGILQLLAELARGSSRVDALVDRTHSAVAAALETLIAIAMEEGDVGLAACHTLAQLPEHHERVSTILRRFLETETLELRRVGLLFLMGQTGDRSPETLSALLTALAASDLGQRRGAALSIARLRPDPLPPAARAAILDALVDEDLEEWFGDLPWDAPGDIDRCLLVESLDEDGRTEAVTRLISAIEAGDAAANGVGSLLDLLFPEQALSSRKPLTVRDLSAVQAQAVRAMAKAMEEGRRIYYGSFMSYGLPDTRLEWQELAAKIPH